MFESKSVTLSLVFSLVLSSSIHADVLIPGTKRVPNTTTVSLGKLADQAWQAYVIKKGDTFSKIAKAHFGDGRRYLELMKANPEVDPKKMKPGKRIELPPKSTFTTKDGKEVGLTAWRFYWSPDGDLNGFSPTLIASGDTVFAPRYSGVIIGIPHDQKDALKEYVKRGGKSQFEVMCKEIKGLVQSDPIHGRRTVKAASATKSIRMSVTLKSVTKGKIATRVKIRYLDQNGKELSWVATNQAPLLGISAVGILLLGGLFLRRRKRHVVGGRHVCLPE